MISQGAGEVREVAFIGFSSSLAWCRYSVVSSCVATVLQQIVDCRMTALLRSLSGKDICQACRVATAWSTGFTRFNSNRASITRCNRRIYPRMYPTTLVLPDGATINFRYEEPRKLIRLPLDLTKLSAEERALRLAKRRPKKKIVIEEEIEETFDRNKYSHLWKRK